MVMSALAQRTRLHVLTLLVAAGGDGMIASDLASAADVPRNLMSAHLAVLSKAGLVEQSKAGRYQIYRAIPGRIADFSEFVTRLSAPGR